jgi:Fic family protein
MKYTWQQKDWPNFIYDQSGVEEDLFLFLDKAGQLDGAVKGMADGDRDRTLVDLMISEAIKSSEIEGEYLSRPDVASSVRNQLGLNKDPEPVRSAASAGMAELMVALRESWESPLDDKTLFEWHRMVMTGSRGLSVGCWRTHEEPMRIVSGPIGAYKVLFEAPPSKQLPKEMAMFVEWFNMSEKKIPRAPVRAAIAHLYFESIHPFEDGNGRVGRAIAEKALSQGLNRPALFSLSAALDAHRSDYYEALQVAQRSMDVTAWVAYFVGVVREAQLIAEKQIDFVLLKARFFDRFRGKLGDRKLKVVQRMLNEGPEGFKGGMSARKYMAITKVSKATATRDLKELAEQGVFTPIGAGRSARYDVNLSQLACPELSRRDS